MLFIYSIPVIGSLLAGHPDLALGFVVAGILNWDWIGAVEDDDSEESRNQ
jgi:hypothetical protein